MNPFDKVQRALFLERPNRFLVRCRLVEGGEEITAYLPNPGRLRELFFPGAVLMLVESASGTRRTTHTVVAVERRQGEPIMLHTHLTNNVARDLLERGLIPGLDDVRVVRAEVTVGHSRFDFLLERELEIKGKTETERILLEVKSCTLVSGDFAMFPDAVTARGARHVRELASLAREGTRTAVLFVVHWPEAQYFSPDYHTDLAFAEALLKSRNDVEIRAMAIGWSSKLALEPGASACKIPWPLIEAEAHDKGSYLVLLELPETKKIVTGKLGEISYQAGWYLYIGSAMANLSKRIDRHRRLRKRKHWHIDYLRQESRFADGLPVRASERLECELAAAFHKLADWTVPRFGASDCRCPSHLLGFEEDPRNRRDFQELLLKFRMDRLKKLISE